VSARFFFGVTIFVSALQDHSRSLIISIVSPSLKPAIYPKQYMVKRALQNNREERRQRLNVSQSAWLANDHDRQEM